MIYTCLSLRATGYNADVAFGQSTAEVIDHAKSLLASLVDKSEESEVQSMAQCRLNKILIRG